MKLKIIISFILLVCLSSEATQWMIIFNDTKGDAIVLKRTGHQIIIGKNYNKLETYLTSFEFKPKSIIVDEFKNKITIRSCEHRPPLEVIGTNYVAITNMIYSCIK